MAVSCGGVRFPDVAEQQGGVDRSDGAWAAD